MDRYRITALPKWLILYPSIKFSQWANVFLAVIRLFHFHSTNPNCWTDLSMVFHTGFHFIVSTHWYTDIQWYTHHLCEQWTSELSSPYWADSNGYRNHLGSKIRVCEMFRIRHLISCMWPSFIFYSSRNFQRSQEKTGIILKTNGMPIRRKEIPRTRLKKLCWEKSSTGGFLFSKSTQVPIG